MLHLEYPSQKNYIMKFEPRLLANIDLYFIGYCKIQYMIIAYNVN